MRVGYSFRGDDNEELKWVQHDAYDSALGFWFRACRGRYLYAERLLAVRTPLGEQIETLRSFDHRSIQDTHDVLAAYFRRDRERLSRACSTRSIRRPRDTCSSTA